MSSSSMQTSAAEPTLAAGLLFSSLPSAGRGAREQICKDRHLFLAALDCWQREVFAVLKIIWTVPSASFLSLGTGDIAANKQRKIPVLMELIFSPGKMRRDRFYMVLPALVKSKSELGGLRAPVCPGRGLYGKWQVWVREVSLIMWHLADC